MNCGFCNKEMTRDWDLKASTPYHTCHKCGLGYTDGELREYFTYTRTKSGPKGRIWWNIREGYLFVMDKWSKEIR